MGREKTEISGIYKNILKKNDDISWSIAKKISGSCKYIPIGKKNKDNIKTAKEALTCYLKQEQDKTPKEIAKKSFLSKRLNEIVEEYYLYNKRIRRTNLEKATNFENYEDFLNSTVYKNGMNSNKKIYEYAYKKYFLNSSLGNMRLEDIEKSHIDDFKERHIDNTLYKDRLEENLKIKKEIAKKDFDDYNADFKNNSEISDNKKEIKVLSEKYIYNMMSYVKSAINYYIHQHSLDFKNPFLYVKISKGTKKKLRVLDRDELGKLLTHTKNLDLTLYLCAYLGIITAARPETILNIKKSDFDLGEGLLYLTNFKVKGRRYTVNLNDEAIAYFKKILVDYDREEFLIRDNRNYADNRKQLQPMMRIPTRFMKILDELFNETYSKKTQSEKITNYYTLRRSVATNIILDGNPLFVAQILLDHNSQKTTEEYINIKQKDIKAKHNMYLKALFKNISFTQGKDEIIN